LQTQEVIILLVVEKLLRVDILFCRYELRLWRRHYMKFKEIEFGMAAAENERSSKPHLLTEGFLDAYGYVNAVLNENKWVSGIPRCSELTLN